MSVKARCLNYTGCLLAYRGEVLELASNAPLVCPECGKTVSVVPGSKGAVGKALGVLLVLGVLGAGGYYAYTHLGDFISRKPAAETTDSTPAPRGGQGDSAPASHEAAQAPEIAPEPPAKLVSPAKLDLNMNRVETSRVRDDVLKRIDVMPNISTTNKDRLYNSVQRARSMGLIVTIPFVSGAAKLPTGEFVGLKTALERPEIMKLREDPTAVFVVLGYADPKGDEKKNIAISQSRADSVLDGMREKCGVNNVMHAVAMGGSKLLDPANLEKNRVVEVWVVLP